MFKKRFFWSLFFFCICLRTVQSVPKIDVCYENGGYSLMQISNLDSGGMIGFHTNDSRNFFVSVGFFHAPYSKTDFKGVLGTIQRCKLTRKERSCINKALQRFFKECFPKNLNKS